MKRTGSCACGAIKFEVSEEFMTVCSCHCTDCQKASGGGPNFIALVPKGATKIITGDVKTYEKLGDSGGVATRAFCGDCGTPMWSEPANLPFTPIKLGAFDEAIDLSPQMQIYIDSAPSWHTIDENIPAFPKMPPPPSE